jgi:NCS1 family nucleobase:cation symporter-1
MSRTASALGAAMTTTETPTQTVTAPSAPGLADPTGLAIGHGAIKPDYDPRLTNDDLAPLKKQTWGTYNIFAFWMSDVHSVGGYVTA